MGRVSSRWFELSDRHKEDHMLLCLLSRVFEDSPAQIPFGKLLGEPPAGDSLSLLRPASGNELIHEHTGGLPAQGTGANLGALVTPQAPRFTGQGQGGCAGHTAMVNTSWNQRMMEAKGRTGRQELG